MFTQKRRGRLFREREIPHFKYSLSCEADAVFITVCEWVSLSLLLKYASLPCQTYQATEGSITQNRKGLHCQLPEREAWTSLKLATDKTRIFSTNLSIR